jgi:hypothetical protein
MTPSEKKRKNKENLSQKQSPSLATAMNLGLKRFSTNKLGLGLGMNSGQNSLTKQQQISPRVFLSEKKSIMEMAEVPLRIKQGPFPAHQLSDNNVVQVNPAMILNGR